MPCFMIDDAILQNTVGYSAGYPAGVPKQYAWYRGAHHPSKNGPPSDFTAVTGWGSVYREASSPTASGSEPAVEVANAKTYVRIRSTQEWMLVQDQSTQAIAGAHFVPDFSGNEAIPMTISYRPDGGAKLDVPPNGYNNHFWPVVRGTYDAGSVDGVYVQIDMRVTDPQLKLLGHVGVDWWRDADAEFVAGFRNNPGAGASNWVRLSEQWSTLRFFSVDPNQFRMDPPPPLVAAADGSDPSCAGSLSTTSSRQPERPIARR